MLTYINSHWEYWINTHQTQCSSCAVKAANKMNHIVWAHARKIKSICHTTLESWEKLVLHIIYMIKWIRYCVEQWIECSGEKGARNFPLCRQCICDVLMQRIYDWFVRLIITITDTGLASSTCHNAISWCEKVICGKWIHVMMSSRKLGSATYICVRWACASADQIGDTIWKH